MECRCVCPAEQRKGLPCKGKPLYLLVRYHCAEVSCELYPKGVAVLPRLSRDLACWRQELQSCFEKVGVEHMVGPAPHSSQGLTMVACHPCKATGGVDMPRVMYDIHCQPNCNLTINEIKAHQGASMRLSPGRMS